MRPIRVAQIGTGHDHAHDIVRELRKNPNFTLVAVCEEDPTYKARALTQPGYDGVTWKSYEEILADDTLDGVVIESEEHHLSRLAIPFAEKGMPIHLDKPGGEDPEEFARLMATVREHNGIFQTGYMYRYNPAVIKARELMQSGALGNILCVEAQMNIKYDAQKTAWLNKFQGGMMFFLGCHLVDLVYTFMGQPQRVIPLNGRTGNEGADAPDYGMAAFCYPTGTSFVKTTCAELEGGNRRQLVVTGTQGVVEIRPLEYGQYPYDYYADARIVLRDAAGRVTTTTFDCPKFARYTAMMDDFAGKIRGENPSLFGYDHEEAVYNLTLQAAGMIP